MGMVVRTNTMALNAYRQLGMNNSAVSKSLEKLSSGFRINRAGDDAAGLAISEKMKAQITGLETASANAQDGISLIQTAEGNLNEVHSMLNRMVELSTKSANGTYTDIERNALQDEVNSLLEEIDRISQSANFNGTRLLDGSLGNKRGADSFTVADAVETPAGSTNMNPVVSESIVNHIPEGTPETTQKQSFYIGNGKALANNGTNDGTITVSYVDSDGADKTAKITLQKIGTTAAATDTASSINAEGIVEALKSAVGDVTASANVVNGTGTKVVLADDGTAGKALKDLFDIKINDHGELEFTAKAAGEGPSITSVAFAGFDDADKAVIEKINTEDGSADAPHDTPNAGDHGEVYDLGTELKGAGHFVQGADATQKNYVHSTAKLTLSNVKTNEALSVGDATYIFQKGDEELTADALAKVKDGATVIKFTDDNDAMTKLAAEIDKADNKIEATFDTDHIELVEDKNSSIANSGQPSDDKVTKMDFEKLINGVKIETSAASTSTDVTVNKGITSGISVTIDGKTYEFQKKADQVSKGNEFVKLSEKEDEAEAAKENAQNLADAYNKANNLSEGDEGYATVSDNKVTFAKAFEENPVGSYRGLTLQIGDTADNFNKMRVAIDDMSTKGLGLDGLKITTEDLASEAIDTIKTAINTVSTARAGMGALQNRLEHTINNLDVAVENLSAANSRIRDTDMAKEMMNYTKMNVLVQSAQAMLAQANQQPQSVLQLLQ